MIQAIHQQENQGEKSTPHVPEPGGINKDLLLDKIKAMRNMINDHFDKNGRV
jgi:hypothetical protein